MACIDEVAKGFAVTAGLATNGLTVCASEIFLFGGAIPTANDTITIDVKVYTWVVDVTAAPADGQVKIGTLVSDCRNNIIAAINLEAGAGTLYSVNTTLHPTAEGAVSSTDDFIARAKEGGTAGDAIALAVSMTDTLNDWTASATTMSGGLDGQTWRNEILVGANDGLEMKTEGITFDVQLIDSDGATGVRSRVSGDRGNEFHSGDIAMDFKYRGLEVLLGLAFGQVADPVAQSGEAAYLHSFSPAASLTGLMGTLVLDKQVSVWEYPSVKIGQITLSGAAGQITEITATIVASGLNRNRTLGTNNDATMASITVPTERQFALFEDLVMSLHAPGAASVLGSDLIYPSAFEITLNNNMATDQVTTRYKREIDEATEDGFFDVSGSLTFPVYETERIVDVAQNKDPLSMQWTFTGNTLITASVFPSMHLYFPEVKFGSASPNMGGPGRIGYTAEFSAARALADPTAFPSGYGASAVVLDLVSGLETNPLVTV